MSRRPSRKSSARNVPARSPSDHDGLRRDDDARRDAHARRDRAIALAGFTALLVAAPLTPSESTAELGVSATWVMVLLGVVAFWLARGFVGRRTTIRWGLPDILAILLAILVWLSTVITATQGNARASFNMAWQWTALLVFFLLGRQLLQRPVAVRAVVAVMLALATALSSLACYQFFSSLPRMRAEYARDPETMLRAAGVDSAADSPERKLFEDRLASTEPLATFALANSLAGFLAPWFIVACGIAACWRRERVMAAAVNADRTETGDTSSADLGRSPQPTLAARRERRQPAGHVAWPSADMRAMVGLLALVLSVALMGFVLLATKSRTALLAVGLGGCLLALWRWSGRRPARAGWAVSALIAAGVGILLAAVAVRVWDPLVLTEAPKSVLYRVQYWEATSAMIADHPWFGCGPGNFQTCYPAYKRPEASESIADPHNLLFEVAATLGLPSLVVFVALLAVVAAQAWRGCRWAPGRRAIDPPMDSSSGGQTPTGESGRVVADADGAQRIAGWAAGSPLGPTDGEAVRGVYLGALLGVGLGWGTGFLAGMTPESALFMLSLPIAVVLLATQRPWVEQGTLSPRIVLVALLTLGMNLLAAGGISFLSVAVGGWLLLAIASSAGPAAYGERPLARSAVALLAGAAALAVAICFFSMYWPVLRCRTKLNEAHTLAQLSRPLEAESALLAATAADPRAAEPWSNLAAFYHAWALQRDSADARARFEHAVLQALERNPQAHALRKQVGDWQLALFARWRQPDNLRRALEAYRAAVRLYPNNAIGRAQLAWGYHLAGDAAAARREAEEALRLDALNPHVERRLDRQRIYDPLADPAQPRENAEQTARRLRKYG